MTSFLGCLCLILTLSMVGSPRGAIIRTGSYSSSWWDSKASSQIRAQARKFETAGDFVSAERLWERGSIEAKRIGDITAGVRYLTSLGACRVSLFRYRAALDALIQARSLAASIGDREDIGAISVNLSSLYLQMWDPTAALRAAEDGQAAMASLSNPYFKPHLLLQLGRVHEILRDEQAVPLLKESIEAARAQGVLAVEITAWDFLGEERLQRGQLDESETALVEAFRLRLLFDRTSLGFSYGRLGALKLAQGDLTGAAQWTQRAITAGARIANTFPAYLLAQQRGQIRLARGDAEGALEDFAKALDLSTGWRLEVLPAATALIGTNAALEQHIFKSFIELGAEHALNTGSRKWAADTFQALEWNRAARLRESLALADVWRKKLPPEYWESLARLSAEDARILTAGGSRSAEAERLELKLTELEAAAGVGALAKKGENFRSRTSLNHFREVLRDSEVVLSFHSGEAQSYLWAMTRTTLSLYRIASGEQLRESVEVFREAVRTGKPEAGQLGIELYSALFGQLAPGEAGKPSWLLSLDGPLFELPFAALVTERKGGKLVYLMERHSLQAVPGALLLSNATARRRSGWFLGVGDPIYNAADPRWRGVSGPGLLAGVKRIAGLDALTETGQLNTGQMSRLVASSDEVQTSAEHWRAGSGTATLLEGGDARRDRFLGLLPRQPAVIHLATHVLTPPQRHQQAFLAFGLGPSAQPEFLATSDVAMLRVPGALVVMTGCATAAGDEEAGTGLLGLTRAWQIAGASAVIATGWPVKDSGGEFFASFYQHLQHSPAAEALHLSQMEMARSNTWRSDANYWASYQVTGATR